MKYYYLSPKTDTWMDVYIGLLGSIHLMWTNSELPRGRSHPTIVWKIGELQVDSPESTPTRPGPSRFELCFGSGLGPVKSCLKINKKSFVLHKKMKRQKEGENKRARERGRRREEEEKEEKKNRRRRGGAHLGCYCCRLWPGTPLPMLTRYATVFPAPSSFSIASTLVPFTLLKRNKINKRKIKQVKKPFKKGEKSRFRPSRTRGRASRFRVPFFINASHLSKWSIFSFSPIPTVKFDMQISLFTKMKKARTFLISPLQSWPPSYRLLWQYPKESFVTFFFSQIHS